ALVARTRSQLAGIAQALTLYKLQYGDYPQTEKAKELFDALTGKMGPKRDKVDPPGKTLLANLSHFDVSHPEALTESTMGTNELLDSWGNPYHYVYKVPEQSWLNPSYLLWSDGIDGVSKTVYNEKGFLSEDASSGENADNIYEPAIQ
ncbi:MAG: hypothetical protein WCL04_00205, partial [Verrucomicrobiota bacterium]